MKQQDYIINTAAAAATQTQPGPVEASSVAIIITPQLQPETPRATLEAVAPISNNQS
jgi:hypothetical protein